MTTDALPLTQTNAPADAAELAEVVRGAFRDKAPVYPIGGATALYYGGRPTTPGMGLSLEKLSRVIDYPADDMTITVDAGLTVAELSERLQSHGQRLPVDVPQAERATIGGVVATASSGPRRYAYGTMRDYVIGVRAVDGTGMEFSGGGQVVKNTAGYNMCRLMVGSLGAIGVITQVTLMLRPMPEASALVVCEVSEFDEAERLLGALVHTQTLPAAIELLAGPAQQGAVLGPMLESSAARLIVGFEGSGLEVDWMVGQLRSEWIEAGIAAPITIEPADADAAWNWLANLRADAEINVRPGATVAMIEQVLRLDSGCSIQAHAGNGTIRVEWSSSQTLPAGVSPSESPTTASQWRELRRGATAAGGNVVLLSHADTEQLTARDVWGPPGDAVAVIRAIKDRFDPQGILNPGRLEFGT